MEPVLDALRAQHGELAGLLAPLGDDDWRRPTPCEGWDIADVVVHLGQTDALALASLAGRFDRHLEEVAAGLTGAESIDDGADLMVVQERGRPAAEIRDEWTANAAALDDVLAGYDLHARVRWVAGELSARTLAATRLAECWIHTGDVADALGIELAPTERLQHIARLAWRTLPYAFARDGRELHGPVAFELRSPSGETWSFVPDDPPATVVRGDAAELCGVAGRRLDPRATGLRAEGPDADAVLALVRTYA